MGCLAAVNFWLIQTSSTPLFQQKPIFMSLTPSKPIVMQISKLFLGAVFSLILVASVRAQDEMPKKGMVKVAILYPNGEGKTFDMEYYANKHMPMAASLFGDALKMMQIDKGMAGRTPDEPVPFLAAGYFYFDSLADYENAFGPNAAQIVGDIPNYTNIQPIVLISEVVR